MNKSEALLSVGGDFRCCSFSSFSPCRRQSYSLRGILLSLGSSLDLPLRWQAHSASTSSQHYFERFLPYFTCRQCRKTNSIAVLRVYGGHLPPLTQHFPHMCLLLAAGNTQLIHGFLCPLDQFRLYDEQDRGPAAFERRNLLTLAGYLFPVQENLDYSKWKLAWPRKRDPFP